MKGGDEHHVSCMYYKQEPLGIGNRWENKIDAVPTYPHEDCIIGN